MVNLLGVGLVCLRYGGLVLLDFGWLSVCFVVLVLVRLGLGVCVVGLVFIMVVGLVGFVSWGGCLGFQVCVFWLVVIGLLLLSVFGWVWCILLFRVGLF